MAHADLPQETRNEIYLRDSVKFVDGKCVHFFVLDFSERRGRMVA